MTEAQVIKEVKRVCNAFRLNEWQVLVSAPNMAQIALDGKVGHCAPDERTMTCEITVAAGRPDAEVNETCLHEVLHLAMRQTTSAFNLVMQPLSQGAWDVAKVAFEEAEERTVIRLVRAFQELGYK
jgi:hypothetical protein